MGPVNETYENISYSKISTSPSLKKWMGSGGGILTMLAVLVLTFPLSLVLLPILLASRNGYYKSLSYKLDADAQTLTIERKGKQQAFVDLRDVVEIEQQKNGNIIVHSMLRRMGKTKLFSVTSETFIQRMRDTVREAHATRIVQLQTRPTKRDSIDVLSS